MNINEFFKNSSLQSRKLHLGCGSIYKEGWCNIDYFESSDSDTHRGNVLSTPDVWCDIKYLSCENDSIDVIALYHVLEHFYKHEVSDVLDEFKRVLKPGGICIIEMPDLSRILKLLTFVPLREKLPYPSDKDSIESQLYGASWERNQESYPYHKYVWKRREFVDFCAAKGFNIVLQTGATLTHKPLRDMAVIIRKPSHSLNEGQDLTCTHLSEVGKYGNFYKRLLRQLKSFIRINYLGIKYGLFKNKKR